jgi:hypothetical protein
MAVSTIISLPHLSVLLVVHSLYFEFNSTMCKVGQGATTLSIMTLSIMTLSINDTQQKGLVCDTQPK